MKVLLTSLYILSLASLLMLPKTTNYTLYLTFWYENKYVHALPIPQTIVKKEKSQMIVYREVLTVVSPLLTCFINHFTWFPQDSLVTFI